MAEPTSRIVTELDAKSNDKERAEKLEKDKDGIEIIKQFQAERARRARSTLRARQFNESSLSLTLSLSLSRPRD